MKVRKLIIPVAGYGTRFLPATKAQPKEMLPVVDKPVVQYIVEEAVKAGIEDIILVTGASKRAVEDHFDYNYELQSWLKKQGKDEQREEMKRIADMANFIYIRQKGPYGNGTPVMCAEKVIGSEPFMVAFGDDLFLGKKKPHLAQLIEVYNKYGDPVLTAVETNTEGTSRYGIIDGIEIEPNTFQVKTLVEKPGPEKAPSLLASIGGYLLTPDIFEVLKKTKIGKGGELWLTDAIAALSKTRPLYARRFEGEYFDLGSKLGWLQANVMLGLRHEELKKPFSKFLRNLD